MNGLEWMLELLLVVLLAVTLFHAVRLERALGVLKRDRAALQELVAGFNDSTRQAEAGIGRLHAAADGAGKQVARQVEAATSLKDDLIFLMERGERLADRLDGLARNGRPSLASVTSSEKLSPGANDSRSQAERELLSALRLAR
jgi:hypothetical protein